MEKLHICAIGVAKSFDQSFERSDRLSISVALLVFNSFRKFNVVFSETLIKSNLFGPVGNFSIKFCARLEKNYLKLLAMEREQKRKPSFSFRQIFTEGVFVLARPSFSKAL